MIGSIANVFLWNGLQAAFLGIDSHVTLYFKVNVEGRQAH